MVRQVVPIDYDSQGLIEAAHKGDVNGVIDCLVNPLVDVNYIGTVSLRVKRSDVIQHEEAPDEVQIEYEEFKTDVTALFVASQAGHMNIIRRLLSAGADVNQKLFRGYATTAAAREGHHEVLGILLKAGASQLACEDALLEACLYGWTKAAELLISSEMIRPGVSVHALVHACCRGFVEIVATLIKSGVDANSWDRMLLRSAKPALYANIDCTPLIAAIVSRQVSVVKLLLEAGVNTDCKVSIGAWSWDVNSGEELRVGAGLAEPYNEAWCAVEYYEASGTILKLLLKHLSPDSEHRGRTLICHAILCRNMQAVKILLDGGANAEFCVKIKNGHQFRPLHMAAKMGCLTILKQMIAHGCDLNAMTETGETALMLSVKANHQECFKELLFSGADLAKVDMDGKNVVNIAEVNNCVFSIRQIISDAIKSGKTVYSSNLKVFSPLHYMARFGDSKVLQKLLEQSGLNLNEQDRHGFSAAMIAAKEGHVEAFKVLIFAGANLNLKNKKGETAVGLAQAHGKRELFESVMLDATLAYGLKGEEFKALHYAARKGKLEAIGQLLKRGYAVNTLDEDCYTPLMLAAKEGHADACKILLLGGADCSLVNLRGETALLLARRNSLSRIAEGVILDHLARRLVLTGDHLCKHTKRGKGAPHMKMVRMLKSGVLTWGKSRRRNVFIKEAVLGPSPTFRRNRRKGDGNIPGTFRIVTMKKREIHFEARNDANAEVWVRGINLIAKEATMSSGPAVDYVGSSAPCHNSCVQREALKSNARFIRRAGGRRMMREPSMLVRENAAQQLEERQSDWAYSKPVIILDILWNLSFVVVSVVILSSTLDERPTTPLRIWIVGYALQCILHMSYVAYEYIRRYRQRLPSVVSAGGSESASSAGEQVNSQGGGVPREAETGRQETEERSSVAKRLESVNTMFSFFWWIVGFYWLIAGGKSLSEDAPRLYWLCIVFLAFDVCFVAFCAAVACMIGIAVCCCLPCIIAILYAVANQDGASETEISLLPKFRFCRIGPSEKNNGEKSTSYGGIMTSTGGESTSERTLSPEDAECCICISAYEDGAELYELPCNHHFHCGCIAKWLRINATCPLCKYNVVKNGSEEV